MRKHQKADLYAKERESGKSISEVAKMYGVSYQAVAQATRKSSHNYFRHYTEQECVYPNLRKWLNDNKVTRSELMRRMGMTASPTNYGRVSHYLKGRNYPYKNTIDKLLEVTGLTYEEFFQRDSGDD